MRTLSLLFALAGIGIPASCPSQEVQDPQPVPSTVLLQRIRAPRSTLDTAREAAAQFVGRKVTDRMRCFDVIARRYRTTFEQYAELRERLGTRAAKAVPLVQRDQLGKQGTVELAALREQARAITRSSGLSKKQIHDDLDPKLARLRELVLVAPRDLLAADEGLRDFVDGMRDHHDELQGWFDLYLDTMRSLEDDATGRRHVDKHEPLPEPPPFDSIDADLDRLSLLKLPLSARDSKALIANEAVRPEMPEQEYLGTLELNRIRIALGLPALAIDLKLGCAARDHSEDMKKLGFFSHTSPVEGKQTFGQRAARFGTSASAENIAAGQPTGAGAIRAWWYSPGHHKNMLAGHGRTGLGRCEGLWTQLFGG